RRLVVGVDDVLLAALALAVVLGLDVLEPRAIGGERGRRRFGEAGLGSLGADQDGFARIVLALGDPGDRAARPERLVDAGDLIALSGDVADGLVRRDVERSLLGRDVVLGVVGHVDEGRVSLFGTKAVDRGEAGI